MWFHEVEQSLVDLSEFWIFFMRVKLARASALAGVVSAVPGRDV